MGNFAGIVRDSTFKQLDVRLNEHFADVKKRLEPNLTPAQFIDLIEKFPQRADGLDRAAADHIVKHWLGPSRQDSQPPADTYFPDVPLETRVDVLRQAFLKAVSIKARDQAAGAKKRPIRTVWVCLWATERDPTFMAGVRETPDEISVTLLAFVTNERFANRRFESGADQDDVHLVGTGVDLRRKFLVIHDSVPTDGNVHTFP